MAITFQLHLPNWHTLIGRVLAVVPAQDVREREKNSPFIKTSETAARKRSIGGGHSSYIAIGLSSRPLAMGKWPLQRHRKTAIELRTLVRL